MLLLVLVQYYCIGTTDTIPSIGITGIIPSIGTSGIIPNICIAYIIPSIIIDAIPCMSHKQLLPSKKII